MRRTGRSAPAALALLVVACGGGPSEDARAWRVERDTLPGGAARVVNAPPEGGAEPDWVLEEELRLGSVDGAGSTSFGQLRGLEVLDDGRIAVLDAQAQEVRIFSPDGEPLRTYGGPGEGPGQLQGAFGLMRDSGGMLWVPEVANARMSVFDPDEGFVRSHRFPLLTYGFVWSGVMTSDDRILKPSMTLVDRSNLLRVYDQEMRLVDSLPMPPDPDVDPEDPPSAFVWGSLEAGARGFYSVPFFPRGRMALDPLGDVWSTAYGDPSYRIVRWTPGGDTTLVLETLRPPVPVTEAERDSVIEVVREALRERGGARQDWSKIPDVEPAVNTLFVAGNGDLWVDASSPGPLRTFDVYARDGAHRGTVETDLAVYPWVDPVVRGDRVWAVVTDELDVHYVVRARLRPKRSGSEP